MRERGRPMNETIQTQLAHRSIRKFKQEAISQDIINTLVDVAQHTSTSNFRQNYSIISITDETKKQQIATICDQNYVAESGHLFIVVLDQYRNYTIARDKGVDTSVLETTDRFLAASMDCALLTQNMVVAAESLGLGAVILGSILNDSKAIIEMLELPEYTFPILGLAIGYPDQEPQLKPRLPREFVHFENTYIKFEDINNELSEYNETVQTYYDLRNSNQRVDSFSNQMSTQMNMRHPKRMQNLERLHEQGLLKK